MSKQTTEKSKTERILDGVAVWASYYRANPHRFAEDYLNVHLKLFQKILLFMMNIDNYFCYIAARGQGKSFLIAIFCCVRCILYPGTKICIASGTRGQSVNILEKIKMELMPNSQLLKSEISSVQITASNACIEFYNGSFIKVVTASDNSRGNRANILIVDEFRMVSQSTIETVLKRFLTAERTPPYLNNPKYKHLSEENKEIYLSSAFYQDHWSYEKVLSFSKNMLDDHKKYFVCGLPYQLSVDEGLLRKSYVEDQMSESNFNEITWSMEMECLWFGDIEGTFFDFNSISKNRKIQYPMLPSDKSSLLGNDKKISIRPKIGGEIRILSADIALMSSKKNKNDASSIFINQLIPTSDSRYMSNIIYTENQEGLHTEDQALRIRKLYTEYNCDYIVMDANGVGLGVYDALVRDLVDDDTGVLYPALSCCNDSEMASRCTSSEAEKVIWSIKANSKFNSDCAIQLREAFRNNKIRLLVPEQNAEKELLPNIKGYNKLTAEEKIELQHPYIDTTLLVDEMINLNHDESGGVVKITEKSGKRKDRYSSLSYNYYVACQLEIKNSRKKRHSLSSSIGFMYRAPKIK